MPLVPPLIKDQINFRGSGGFGASLVKQENQHSMLVNMYVVMYKHYGMEFEINAPTDTTVYPNHLWDGDIDPQKISMACDYLALP